MKIGRGLEGYLPRLNQSSQSVIPNQQHQHHLGIY